MQANAGTNWKISELIIMLTLANFILQGDKWSWQWETCMWHDQQWMSGNIRWHCIVIYILCEESIQIFKHIPIQIRRYRLVIEDKTCWLVISECRYAATLEALVNSYNYTIANHYYSVLHVYMHHDNQFNLQLGNFKVSTFDSWPGHMHVYIY